MRRALSFLVAVLIGVAVPATVSPADAFAQEAGAVDIPAEGATVAVITPERTSPTGPTYVTLSTGGLMFVRGQRFVVTSEPAPSLILEEGPPPPPSNVRGPTETNARDALWVPGHYVHGADGFTWVEGRYITSKPGHAFVPPRWVFVQDRFLFFDGFFVPHRVWVRSFFNTYHFSGDPNAVARNGSQTRDRGPYWPIGVSGRPVGTATTRGRGPYWPLGLGPPTVLRTSGGSPVGLPSNNRR